MKEEDTPSLLRYSEGKSDPFATVRIHGNLGKLQSGKRIEIEKVPVPIKVGEMLDRLSTIFGLEIRRDSTLVLLNGVEANVLEDLDTIITEGDEVSLVPMFHGGQTSA